MFVMSFWIHELKRYCNWNSKKNTLPFFLVFSMKHAAAYLQARQQATRARPLSSFLSLSAWEMVRWSAGAASGVRAPTTREIGAPCLDWKWREQKLELDCLGFGGGGEKKSACLLAPRRWGWGMSRTGGMAPWAPAPRQPATPTAPSDRTARSDARFPKC